MMLTASGPCLGPGHDEPVPNHLSLYIGGSFRRDGGTGANRLAVLATGSGAWSDLGHSTDHSMLALAVLGGDLFLGGRFGVAGDFIAGAVARRVLAGGAESPPAAPAAGAIASTPPMPWTIRTSSVTT